jgi:hypothetical protein
VNKRIISAIRNKKIVTFSYKGQKRRVEPQTYGVSTAGHEVLRAAACDNKSKSGQFNMAKLFRFRKYLS